MTRWFLLTNRYGGGRVMAASSPVEARRAYRMRIAESFVDQGVSPSASRRAGESYRVSVDSEYPDEASARQALAEWESHNA